MTNKYSQTQIGKSLVLLMSNIDGFKDVIKTSLESKSSKLDKVEFNKPIYTGEVINGRKVMFVLFDFGALPNNTVKCMAIPSSIREIWGTNNEHWLDLSNSHAYKSSTGIHYPLPGVPPIKPSKQLLGNTKIEQAPKWWDILSEYDLQSDQISIYMTDDDIIIETQTDRRDCVATVAVRFLGEQLIEKPVSPTTKPLSVSEFLKDLNESKKQEDNIADQHESITDIMQKLVDSVEKKDK